MTSNGQLCISLRDSILYVYNAVSDECYKTSVWFEDDYDWRVTEDEINLVYTNGEKLVEKDYSVDGPEETVLSDSCHRFLCQDVYLWYADDTGVVYRSNYNGRNRKITTINDIYNWDVVGNNLYHIDNSGLHRVNSDGEDEILDKSAETMEYTEGDEFIVYTDKYEDTHILLGKNNWIIDLDELE